MEGMIWAFDLLIGVSLIILAFHIVNSRNPYRAVVMFLIFGLLAAVVWARLRAGDIALAEAAIGAGVTGALFLSTIGRLRGLERYRRQAEGSTRNTLLCDASEKASTAGVAARELPPTPGGPVA